jgi:hypothetical protein
MGLGMNNDVSEEAQRQLADDEQVMLPIAVSILRLRHSHGHSSVGPPLKSQTLLYDSENDHLLRK